MNDKIYEVAASDWPVFCRRISEQQSGAMVKVAGINSDGIKSESIAGATFLGMIFNGTGACNNVITLRLRNGREIVHEILDPIYIRLNPSAGAGDFNPLEIKAENGMTIITFHPAVHAQILTGLRIA